LTCVIWSITNEAFSQGKEKVFEVGEELKYEVSYGFIKLGFVKFVLTNSRKEDKKSVYNARLEIKSYPEVPFIKLNEIFETVMCLKKDEVYSEKFFETNFKDKSIIRTDYKFNYPKNTVKVLKEKDGNIEKDFSKPIEKNTYLRDEISWIYDARINSFENKNFNIPVFVNEEETSVRYSFNTNRTVVNIEKYDFDIMVIKMEGIADFTGFFGFKGEFLILLSDDEERVPIKAYFNSTLGNVVWELTSFKKNKWTPPAFMK